VVISLRICPEKSHHLLPDYPIRKFISCAGQVTPSAQRSVNRIAPLSSPLTGLAG